MTDRITTQDLVNREVLACVSSLVSTLAAPYGDSGLPPDLNQVCEQAFDLASPVEDWEEAARQNGWQTADLVPGAIVKPSVVDDSGQCSMIEPSRGHEPDWEAACQLDDIDPYEWEVYEHWIVSDWLADKLIEQGEKVDKDFTGLCVWARTTTGQAISMDAVIERIHAKLLEA